MRLVKFYVVLIYMVAGAVLLLLGYSILRHRQRSIFNFSWTTSIVIVVASRAVQLIRQHLKRVRRPDGPAHVFTQTCKPSQETTEIVD